MIDKNSPWEQDGVGATTNKPILKVGSITDIDLRRLVYTWPFILIFGIFGFGVGKTFTNYMVESHSTTV